MSSNHHRSSITWPSCKALQIKGDWSSGSEVLQNGLCYYFCWPAFHFQQLDVTYLGEATKDKILKVKPKLLVYGDIVGHLKGSLSGSFTVSTTNTMLVHCKSQEVNGIVIILHTPRLWPCKFVIFKQLQAATFWAQISCMCTIGTVWFLMCNDDVVMLSLHFRLALSFLHRFSQ